MGALFNFLMTALYLKNACCHKYVIHVRQGKRAEKVLWYHLLFGDLLSDFSLPSRVCPFVLASSSLQMT